MSLYTKCTIKRNKYTKIISTKVAKNLSEYLRASTIDKEWENIKTAIEK